MHPQAATTAGSVSTTASVAPAGVQGVLVTTYGAASVVVAVLLCLALRGRARRYGDLPLAERFSLFAVLQVAVGVLLVAVGVIGYLAGVEGELRPEGGAAAFTVVLVVGVVAMEVWFLATLHGARTRPWLQDTAPAVEDPALS
jgi:hypothetical protein